ncbi:MAG: hypothetical protein NTNFB02_00500 [Nitrospira sp.]
MAWKAKTLAKTLMTVALEMTFGSLSAMTDRFRYVKANMVIRSSLRTSSAKAVQAAFAVFSMWRGTSK